MGSLYVGMGAIALPVDESLIEDTVTVVADPAKLVLATLLKTALISECNAAWEAAKPADIDGYVVGSILPVSPKQSVFLAVKQTYPVLCIQRESSSINEATLSKLQRTTDWGIYYIMPELDEIGIGKLYDLLTLTETVIINTIERGGHPDYNDGYLSFGDAGFYWWQVVQSQVMNMEFVTEQNSMVIFPAIKLTMRTIERDYSTAVLNDYEGANIGINLVSPVDGYDTLSPFVQVQTDFTTVTVNAQGAQTLVPNQIGQVLYSTDGINFTTRLPITAPAGWLVNNSGELIVSGP